MTATGAPAIELLDLAKSYGAVPALRGVTLAVATGEIFGFLGLNGAGKTTAIRIVLDLIRPTRGAARVFGADCQRDGLRVRAQIGYLPGELGLYPDMTGGDVLELTASLARTPVDAAYRARLFDALEFARADLDRRLREYSTGMKRKLGLIQALQTDPPLLLLDEPTEGLDPLVQRALHQVLFDLRSRGRTIFMSSHVLSEVERLCDRIAVIRRGEIVFLSTVEEARRRSGRTIRVHLDRPADLPALPAGVTVVAREPALWTLRVAGDIGDLVRALAGPPVRDLEVVEPALEDVLRSFYREEPR
jgi:beta-exotoxin I transport system ATP-binding protein